MNLRANTKAGYRSILRRYLRPALGSYPLARIDVLAVRTWLAKLEAGGVGQATRAKAYRLLARILGAAVEARYLAVNPCGIRGAASDGAPEMRIATVDQVAAMANRVPTCYRALVLGAAFGGLGWGELLGLRRQRVDLERGTSGGSVRWNPMSLPGQRLPVAAEFAGGAVVGQGGCPQHRGGALGDRARSHGLGAGPGGGQAGAHGIHQDGRAGQLGGQGAGEGVQGGLADAVAGCRPTPPGQAELVVAVGAGAAGDVHDPRMGALS